MRDGWEDTTLGAFITQSKKKVKVLHGEVYPAVGVMMEGRGFVTREPFIGGKTTYKQLTPIEPNQLVLRSITAWEAPIQVTTDDHVGFHVSGVFPVFDIDSAKINPRFLGLHCQYNPFWESMRERTVGSVLRRKTLSAKALMEIPIELPPLPEQQRIVDLISSVDSYIDALRQQLEKAKGSRGAVLHELLAAGGDGWVKTPIGEVAQVLSGFAFKSEHFNKSEGMPLIRIRDLPKRNHTEALYSGSYEDRYVVRQGDFLIGMDGEFHCYEWSGPDALLNQRVCRIQDFKRNLVEPRFIYFAINQYLDKIEQDTGYTTVKHISSKQILGITIPLPPLLEQKQIVDLISTVDSHTDAIQDQLASSASLRSALLADLLSGNHEIPASYDQLIGAA